MNNINRLIEYARSVKIPIFYTSIEMLPTKYESSARLYTYNKLFARMQQQSMLEKRDMYIAVDRKEDEGDGNNQTYCKYLYRYQILREWQETQV